mgnify:CR=1 FL=1
MKVPYQEAVPEGPTRRFEAGSGALTLGHPSSPGVPSAITDNTLLLPFNDLDAALYAGRRGHRKNPLYEICFNYQERYTAYGHI